MALHRYLLHLIPLILIRSLLCISNQSRVTATWMFTTFLASSDHPLWLSNNSESNIISLSPYLRVDILIKYAGNSGCFESICPMCAYVGSFYFHFRPYNISTMNCWKLIKVLQRLDWWKCLIIWLSFTNCLWHTGADYGCSINNGLLAGCYRQ